MQYHLRVVLENEHAGLQYNATATDCGFDATPYKPCDENGFALEIDDESGTAAGTFAPFINERVRDRRCPDDADSSAS